MPQFVGRTTNVAAIKSVIRSQIFMESAVARLPEPEVDVQDAQNGSVYVYIRYRDSTTGGTQVLSFAVNS